LITLIEFSSRQQKHWTNLLQATIRFFLISTLIFGLYSRTAAQDVPQQQSSIVAEEQDYAFAYGLYRDSLFQLASQQFLLFAEKYPASIKHLDAAFLGIECLFQSSQYQSAETKYNEFIQRYPTSRYIPESYLKLGQSRIHLKKTSMAIAALKVVLDQYGETEKAGEAAYWIGEAYLQNDDTQNALKYYTLAYENFPKNRLRDYALYSIAWTYQKRTEYAKSAEWYGKLIDEFPQSPLSPGAYVHIGECIFYAREYHRAIDVLTKSRQNIHDETELGNADYLLAESFYKLGDISSAQKRYEQFLLEHPQHKLAPDATYALGWSYLNQKNLPRAFEIFQSLGGRSDDIGHASLYRRAVIERMMGKRDQALQTLNEVLKRWPQGEWSDHAFFDLGMMFFEENNLTEAKSHFQRLVTEYPESDVVAEGYRMLGECSRKENNFKIAQNWFEKAQAIPSASFETKMEASFESALCFFKLQQYNEAAAGFSAFAQQYTKHPKSGEAKFYEAEAEYRLGNFNKSAQLYQASAGYPGTTRKEESFYGIAWSFYKQGKFQPAIGSFEKLLVAYPKGKFAFDARVRLGDAYFFLKEYKKAIVSYRMAIRLFADSTSRDYAYYQLGQSYMKDGDNTDAYKVFEELVNTLPQSPLADDAQFAEGWINFQRKEYGDAIKEFQKLLKIYPKSELAPRTWYSLGDSYYNLQQYAAAEKSYREVLKRFPNSSYSADALSGIQYCFIAQGRDAEAVGVIDDFIKENPGSNVKEDLQLRKGELLFNQKKYAAAATLYRKFTEQNSNSPLLAQALSSLAKCYRMQANPDEAALTYVRAANTPNASEKIIGESLFEAAEIYDSRHKEDKAIHTLQLVQDKVKDPEIVAEAKVRMGRVFLSAVNVRNASEQFDQVIRDFGDMNAADAARVARARIYFQASEFDSAKTVAEKAAKSRKDELGAEAQYIIGASFAGKKEWANVITALLRVKYIFPSYERWVGRAYLGLGDAYEQTNDKKHARESYQAALKSKTDSSVINEAQRRLKKMGQR
jgi:TolA-binding protein